MAASKHYDALSLTTSPTDLDLPGFTTAGPNATWAFAFTGDHTEDLQLLDDDGSTVIQTIPAGELVAFGGDVVATKKGNAPTKIKASAATNATFSIHRVA